ncbi:sensor histidine kinase [Actinomadura algeriensis]|uniref:Oxygen sensor histidine kinase NreB n=1 Tax=Actinomadura algeriensis TaxID=1679523 RepID=A0ABR9JS48_9ACTN|nr:sensor histidine kinase [Actinomadura algeriensis]MBE1533380.1 signal transduction histidine kinase [Actinomadura algeriensis]
MSIEAELREEFDRWEHRERMVVGALPYPLLAASTVITLLQPLWDVPVRGPAVLGLTLATALWVLWFYRLPPQHDETGPRNVLYYTGLMLLGAGLVTLAPWYGIFMFVGYLHAFVCLQGGWRYAGVATTAVISSTSYVGGMATVVDGDWGEWAIICLVTVGLSGTFFRFADMNDRRNSGQKRALVELHEANRRLEAALEENAGLHAQLLVQAREAGVLDERQRMAREIHDTLAQGLAGVLAQLQAAEQRLDEPATLQRHMTTAMNLTRESLTEARRTVHAVEPSALAEARLPEAIGDVTQRWAEANGVDAALTTTGDARPMHADVEVALLRTAQEALANVAKHAKAGRVGLTLSYMEDLVTLDVRDDGVGFDPSRRAAGTANGGFGLTGMRQRVQRLSGRLDIESEPGGGTAISATVPAIPAGGME